MKNKKMKISDIEKELRNKYEEMLELPSNENEKIRTLYDEISKLEHQLELTPFASGESGKYGLKDYGFHVFIGKVEIDHGSKCFTTLGFGSDISYTALDTAFKHLCSAVKKIEKYYYQKVLENCLKLKD